MLAQLPQSHSITSKSHPSSTCSTLCPCWRMVIHHAMPPWWWLKLLSKLFPWCFMEPAVYSCGPVVFYSLYWYENRINGLTWPISEVKEVHVSLEICHKDRDNLWAHVRVPVCCPCFLTLINLCPVCRLIWFCFSNKSWNSSSHSWIWIVSNFTRNSS